MRFFVSLLLVALFSFIAGKYLPWWSIAVVAFLVALCIPQSLGKSFLSAFAGIFLLWAVLAGWIDFKNEHILSEKIAQLFGLGNAAALVLITALVGAMVAGFASMSASSLHGLRR